MIRRPPRSTLSSSSAASDVYKRQGDERDPEIRRDVLRERPPKEVEEVGHDLAHRRGREVHEVERAVARVAGMVIDVHDHPREEIRPPAGSGAGAGPYSP